MKITDRGLLRSQGAQSLAFAGGVLVIGLACVFGLGGDYTDSILVYTLCFAIVLVGMVVQVGYSHQLAFHQAVFMMVGAYTVAVLNARFHVAVWLAMLVAVVGCAVVGGLLGSYVTRVSGFAVALATLFFSNIMGSFVSYNDFLGNVNGIGPVDSVWDADSYIQTFENGGVIVVAVLALSVLVASRIMRSAVGLELSLLSTNERMAEAIGVLTGRRKLELFILGSAFAGLGGAVFAATQTYVTPDVFTGGAQITLLVMLYFGGRTSLVGGLIGALVIEYIAGVNNFVALNQGIIDGVLMTGVLLFAPSGIVGVLELAAERLGLNAARPHVQPSPPGPLPDAQHRSDALGSFENAAPRVECRGVTKRFGGVVAVDNVSFAIRGLGIHAICGPNGAGKSTLFELIAGGRTADGGSILIDGTDVTRFSAAARAQMGIARTFQTVGLMNGRTVLDNVAVAALSSHRGFLTDAIVSSQLETVRERAWSALHRVGIAHLADRRPGQLTLESQRMVELARAIVARPRIILLDEPASGLSVDQRTRLAEMLVELSEHTTILLVEHDLEMVARIAREIFVLVEGRLVFQGNGEAFARSEVVRTELMGLVAAENIPPVVGPCTSRVC